MELWIVTMVQMKKDAVRIYFFLKTVAFIASKKNPADQNFYIFFPLKESLKTDLKGETASKFQFRPT